MLIRKFGVANEPYGASRYGVMTRTCRIAIPLIVALPQAKIVAVGVNVVDVNGGPLIQLV